MISLDNMSPTERRLLNILLDYRQHTKQELLTCIGDPEGGAFGQRMFHLRRKLRVNGFSIAMIRLDGTNLYQLTRQTTSPHRA